MNKRYLILLVALLTASCSTNPYVMSFDGEGGYGAYSRPAYRYVDDFWFRYHGPYSLAWYQPVWYSPISGCHYRSRCSGHYWGGYYGWYGYGGADYGMPIERRAGSGRVDDPGRASRSIPPLDMKDVVIGSGDTRYSSKQRSYQMSRAKRYSVASAPDGGYRSSAGRYSKPRTSSSKRTARARRDPERVH